MRCVVAAIVGILEQFASPCPWKAMDGHGQQDSTPGASPESNGIIYLPSCAASRHPASAAQFSDSRGSSSPTAIRGHAEAPTNPSRRLRQGHPVFQLSGYCAAQLLRAPVLVDQEQNIGAILLC